MNTCDSCGNKGKGHGEQPCVACVNNDKWVSPVDGMRELAMKIAAGVGLYTDHLPDGFAVLFDLDPLERIVRAAVVEGMRRAAGQLDSRAKQVRIMADNMSRDTRLYSELRTAQFEDENRAADIRAEAERIKG